jgi:hypothetical protein
LNMPSVFIKYGLFFSVQVRHLYYRNGISPDLYIEPDAVTRKLLLNRRLISKPYPGELKIISELNTLQEYLETVDNVDRKPEKHAYTFLLKTTTADFFSKTKMDLPGYPNEVYYFTNTAKSVKLATSTCILAERILVIPFEKGKTPAKIKVSSNLGETVTNIEIEGKATQFTLDMYPYSSGVYGIEAMFGKSEGKTLQNVYLNPSARKEGVLGIIQINSTGIATLDEGKQFQIQFEPLPSPA